ncbi:MAG: hypothetical protein KDB86_14760 [Actinobacteria bacterium]|nr:hypothetical protein [Actinomycetota bacterium]MCB9390195.1 hypothetical protein [Acidimicrobiia bacterium]
MRLESVHNDAEIFVSRYAMWRSYDLVVVMERRAGDFEQWYRDAHPGLGASLTVVLGDASLAQESVDEAFSRALQRWDRVSQMESPRGWVYRVALNDARRRLRRAGLERRLLRTSRISPVAPPAGELWLVVSELPQRQREAVVLRHVGELRENEIAEAMGITRGTVSATLRAAYRSLRVAIDDSQEVGAQQ